MLIFSLYLAVTLSQASMTTAVTSTVTTLFLVLAAVIIGVVVIVLIRRARTKSQAPVSGAKCDVEDEESSCSSDSSS